MNKFLIVLLTLLFNIQQAFAFNVDAFMDKHIAPVSDAVANVIFYPVNFFGSNVQIRTLMIQTVKFHHFRHLLQHCRELSVSEVSPVLQFRFQ